ncbi:MAG: hypothetical protein ACTHKR_11080 [Sphingomonas sp.]
MARRLKLKVFRTPIGFHDAYVAAPSQKAALEAWGSEHNLFASGAAERVDDPALTREPLAHPGQVIRRARGTTADHLAALPKGEPKRAGVADTAGSSNERTPGEESRRLARSRPKPKPRPSRKALDEAEALLAAMSRHHRDRLEALRRQEIELERERRRVEAAQDRERSKINDRIERERSKYDRAMRVWRAS